jgi:DNA-directed RNA polymerase I subunit RPA2
MPSTARQQSGLASTAKIKPTFNTLQREHSFAHPSTTTSEFPALQAAIQPHIDSFNAITVQGLLEVAVRDIGRKTIFDHKSERNGGRGDKLAFWLEDVQLSRPALSSRERTSLNRRLYPSEVRIEGLRGEADVAESRAEDYI